MNGVYAVPVNLSPSRVEAFTTCPMAFRFASIEKIAEPPSIHTTKGSFVHRVLELLYAQPNDRRTVDDAAVAFAAARAEYVVHPDLTQLHLDDAELAAFFDAAWSLVLNDFAMENPGDVRAIGIELYLEANVGHLTLRGIIDRLELDAQGNLIVTDYKTGRAPGVNFEQNRLGGVHFYSFLCEAVFGRRPSAIRLMYLRSGETITATPTERSVRFLTQRTQAVWKAVEKACETGDFRPRPSLLCGGCSFKPWCPAFGGIPDNARHEAPLAFGLAS